MVGIGHLLDSYLFSTFLNISAQTQILNNAEISFLAKTGSQSGKNTGLGVRPAWVQIPYTLRSWRHLGTTAAICWSEALCKSLYLCPVSVLSRLSDAVLHPVYLDGTSLSQRAQWAPDWVFLQTPVNLASGHANSLQFLTNSGRNLIFGRRVMWATAVGEEKGWMQETF